MVIALRQFTPAGAWFSLLLVLCLAANVFGAEKLTPDEIKVLQAMAEKGDADSQYRMGMLCYEGDVVPKDMAEAFKWFSLAVSQGEKRGVTLLKEVELFMTAKELAEGKRRAAEETAPTNRLTVALLGWENKTGDSAVEHWREAVDYLISSQLGEVRSLRLVGGVEYGLRQLNKKVGDPIEAVHARKLGELIEARRVIWGNYRRDGDEWIVTVRLLKVATGEAAKDMQAASTDWNEIGDQLCAQVLKELGVTPTASERRKMARRNIPSSAVLESLMKCRLGDVNKSPLGQLEQYARQAVNANPQCAAGHLTVAAVLGSQGKLKEAEQEARKALEIQPDACAAHYTFGVLLLRQDKFEDAEKELQIATKLDPEDPEPLERLGQMYRARDRLDAAVVQFQKALQLSPFDGTIRAELGCTYAMQRQREKALAELTEAKRLADTNVISTEQILAMAYYKLREAPAAVEHLERFVTLTRKRGFDPEGVKTFDAYLQEMRARLSAVYVTAAPPMTYNETTLTDVLRQRLSQEEFGQVTNPLACTPEMNKWAQELTKGYTNDFDKAQKLFAALAHRLDSGDGGDRTAPQVFAAWNDPSASFRCQEHAFLYVTLARAAGLNAHFTAIWQNTAGENVHHACAAVYFADKVLLVDPKLAWFGAPHKKYVVMDDLQILAHYLCQLDGLKQRRMAAKLWPDSTMVRFNLGMALMNEDNEDQWAEGQNELAAVLKLEPDGYAANLGRARIALREAELEVAVNLLRTAIKINSTEVAPHLLLATIAERRGELREARIELRRALRCEISDEAAQEARRKIAEINEKIGND